MEVPVEEGLAFAIPDLWQKSSLAQFEEQDWPLEIHALGTSFPRRVNLEADTLRYRIGEPIVGPTSDLVSFPYIGYFK